MAYILPSTANDSARIGYKNLFTTSGVTVATSSDQTGFEKENAYDWKSYTWWKPSAAGANWLRASFGAAKSADYMAISGHNIGTLGATVKCQYSTNGGSTWNDIGGTIAPADDNVIFVVFDSTSAADWRIYTDSACTIGVVSIGETTELPVGMGVGFNIPTMAQNDKFNTSVSEGGEHIGNSLRRQNLSFTISLNLVDPAWIRSTWQDFIDHARLYPFFFSWDSENHSDEAVYCWVNKAIAKPSYISPVRGKVSLNVEGRV